MTKLLALLVGSAISVSASSAHALLSRTFVSGQGVDNGTCALAAPCRTFQFAHDQTAPNGELAILNTAGYGALTISKAISIVNPGGVEAGIAVAAGADAITIAAAATDRIALRGLTIDGQTVGSNGIVLNSGLSLDIIDCVVRDFTAQNIFIRPSNPGRFAIVNTTSSNGGTSGTGNGVYVAPVITTGIVTGVISKSTLIGSGTTGLSVFAGGSSSGTTTFVTVSDSVLSNNSIGTFAGSVASGGIANVVFQNATISGNTQYGVWSVTNGGPSTAVLVRLGHSVLSRNGLGVFFQGGTVSSLGNNLFSDNTTDVSGGTLGTLTPK